PILAVLTDHLIEGGYIFGRAFKKLVSKGARFVRGFGALPEFSFQFGEVLLAHVPLKKHLEGELAGFGAKGHVTFGAAFPPLRALRRLHSAYGRAAPSRWLQGLLRSPCCRPSAPPGQWPARVCRTSVHKK